MDKRIFLSRRGFLAASTAAGVLRGMPLQSALNPFLEPACVLASEQEEGPYYIDDEKTRADIREGKPGVPLKLRIGLVHAKTCQPLTNAAVDIWHCDAMGIYSGFTANHGGPGGRPPGPPEEFGGPGGGPPGRPPGPPPDGFGPSPGGHRVTDASRFLRGVQKADASGMVEFMTVYPGWYMGRAIHIHMKVHAGGHVAHTGQLFFPEEVTERISKLQPYAKHQDVHLTRQDEDMVFGPQHGAGGLVRLERVAARSDSDGFVAAVSVAVDPEAEPVDVMQRGVRPD